MRISAPVVERADLEVRVEHDDVADRLDVNRR